MRPRSNVFSVSESTFRPIIRPIMIPSALRDTLGRCLRDLRISVTDRCNFRCSYCLPPGAAVRFLPRHDLLSFEEIRRIAGIAHALGVRKLRLTGGEPLLRRDLPALIARLAELPEVDLALTTNGALLASMARPLVAAGLARVTVSLDALDGARFRQISGSRLDLAQVLAGIEAAAQAGLAPVKINCVLRRGVNDDQIEPLLRHFRGSGHILRFIEYMDAGGTHAWQRAEVVPAAEVLARIAALYPLEPLVPVAPGEVVQRWRFRDGGGEIGIIASVTQPFCRDCNRLRLSSDGRLYTCLFASEGFDLRALLRAGRSDEEILSAIAALWSARDDRYSELRRSSAAQRGPRMAMSYIGG